jgi:hypothetical protein
MFPAGSAADSLAAAQAVVNTLSLVVAGCRTAPQEGHDSAIMS